MSYLSRLARRATGLYSARLLQPNVRRWGVSYDPFENEVIQSPVYPNTSSQQRAVTHTSNVRQDVSIVQHNHQKSHDVKKTEIKTTNAISRHEDNKQVKSADKPLANKVADPADNNFLKQHPSSKQRNNANQRDLTFKEDYPASKNKSTPLDHHPAKTSHKHLEKDEPVVTKMSCPRLLRRLADKAATTPQVSTKSIPTMQQAQVRTANTIKNENLIPGLQRVKPSKPIAKVSTTAQRRKQREAQTEAAPRLIIGSLKVDVVPVANKTKQCETTRSVARHQKTNSKQATNQQTVKMKFGLGQM